MPQHPMRDLACLAVQCFGSFNLAGVSFNCLSEELWDPWTTPVKTSPQPPLTKRQAWFKQLRENKAWQKEQKKKTKGKAKEKKGKDKDKEQAEQDWWSSTDGPDHKKWSDWQDWADGSGSAGAAPWNDGANSAPASAAVK